MNQMLAHMFSPGTDLKALLKRLLKLALAGHGLDSPRLLRSQVRLCEEIKGTSPGWR